MIDINLIRDDSTRCKVIESEKKRFRDGRAVDEAHELDRKRIRMNFELDEINKKVNKLNREIKQHFKDGGKKEDSEVCSRVEESERLCNEADDLKEQVKGVEMNLARVMKGIGNLVFDEVFVSNDDENNMVVGSYRSERRLEQNPEPFSVLMKDYTYAAAGAKVVGHRGYYLSGAMAKLAQALGRYAIDFLEKHGYVYIQTPVMLRRDVMARTSQLSDFDDQLYKVEDDMYLIATSEQSLSALYMEERIVPQDLPKKFCGQSLCFRKEAGAHGKDNAGLFRVHQFEKIEQFIVCGPEESEKHHKDMMRICEEFYQSLDISYNVVSIVSGALNDAAAVKYDLEAFFPCSGKYRELVSCSNCTDYQSRELDIRYGIGKDNKRKVYVHLLNGTMCAIQRTLCCIVENYQCAEGVMIPKVLQGYFGGSIISNTPNK
ncbi:seryl-tRNA synthetase [Ordospora colligata]|nr:seryl-tRNA synthetase [Ordospora colligata]